jgi:hypothetical protein
MEPLSTDTFGRSWPRIQGVDRALTARLRSQPLDPLLRSYWRSGARSHPAARDEAIEG